MPPKAAPQPQPAPAKQPTVQPQTGQPQTGPGPAKQPQPAPAKQPTTQPQTGQPQTGPGPAKQPSVQPQPSNRHPKDDDDSHVEEMTSHKEMTKEEAAEHEKRLKDVNFSD